MFFYCTSVFVPLTPALFIKTWPKASHALLNGRVNGGTIGGEVKFHSHGSDGGVRAWRRVRTGEVVDFVAERVEAMAPASSGVDVGAGFGEVETEVAAEARGSAGDHDHLAF